MVSRRPFGKLTVAIVACALPIFLASCSETENDNIQRPVKDRPSAFTVTVIAIEMEDKDSGQQIEVGGEVITGSVLIRPIS
jgi:hypothetical protein